MLVDVRPAAWMLRHRRLAPIVLAAFTALLMLGVPAAASAAPKDAFVSDDGASSVFQLTISADQTLSFSGSTSSGSGPMYEAVTPNGKFLYVADDGIGFDGDGTTLSQYSIGSTGTLTPLSPATVTTGQGPAQVAVSPDGKNAYVASFEDGVTEYSIASNGTLTSIGTLTSGLEFPEGIAVSPDGSSVYVSDAEADAIFQYDRGSDGLLTPKTPATVPYSAGAAAQIAMSPNGKYLYASGDDEGVDQYTVGSGGLLSPMTVPLVATGGETWGVIVSPNGHNVYTSDCGGGGDVSQFSVGSNGELTAMTPATVSTDGCGAPWMTANGASLYAPDQAHSLYQFTVSASGALSPASPASVSDPSATTLLAVTIPPDQGPVAEFSVKAGKAGKATKFNASSSSDADGTVTSYQWSFGDGHTLTTTAATVSHTYKKVGKYAVTLTVTDDSGCSTTQVFTGQTAYCNPTQPTTSHTVKVAAAKQRLKLAVSPKRAKAGQSICYAFTTTSKGRHVKKVSVKLDGHTTHTSGDGKAKLCLTLKKGVYSARASKKGYDPASTRITISAAAPVFTG